MSLVDRIQTNRLILREHTLQDFDALHAMWSEPAVYHHIIGRPSTREESWNRLLRYTGHWALLGYGYWVVEERVSGAYVGEMGFADYHRDIDPPLDDRPEMGWALKTAVHGKGYATEACSRSRPGVTPILPGRKHRPLLPPKTPLQSALPKKSVSSKNWKPPTRVNPPSCTTAPLEPDHRSLLFLAPWGRGRGPTRKCWEGEGAQVSQLHHLFPLILPSFAWAPPSPQWGEGKQGNFDSNEVMITP